MDRAYRLLVLFLMGLTYGCGGGDEEKAAPAAGGEEVYEEGCGCGEEDELSGGEYTPEKGTATIKGAVQWEGKPPRRRPIDMGSEQYCVNAHTEPMLSETTVVGPNGGLANVFVHVTGGLTGWKFPKGSGEVLLDQHGCQYVPHVLGVQVGQALRIRNSDPIMHNIHANDMKSGRDMFNFSQTQKGAETVESKVARRPGFVQVKCDVHGWMGSYICITRYPFFAVTGEDGAFTLEKLPPGEYTIEAWHEKYGTKTATVTVADGETKEISFVFSK